MQPLICATTAGVFAAGYALGCVNFGYYLVRLTRGSDIRDSGSHGTGATNVGRQLGTAGFLTTFVLDAAKGAGAIALAWSFALGPGAQWAVAFGVVLGHIWPIQLRFRGGRGVATWIGALAMLEPLLLAVTAMVTAIALRPLGGFTRAGLLGIATVPVAAVLLDRSFEVVVGTTALLLIVGIAHRPHLRRQVRSPDGDSSALPLEP